MSFGHYNQGVRPIPTIIEEDARTDLSLSKSVTPSDANVNDTVTYSITLTNSSDTDATGIKIKDSLPECFEINLDANSDPVIDTGQAANFVGTDLIIDVPTVPANSTVTITYSGVYVGDQNASGNNTGTYIDGNNDTGQWSIATIGAAVDNYGSSPLGGVYFQYPGPSPSSNQNNQNWDLTATFSINPNGGSPQIALFGNMGIGATFGSRFLNYTLSWIGGGTGTATIHDPSNQLDQNDGDPLTNGSSFTQSGTDPILNQDIDWFIVFPVGVHEITLTATNGKVIEGFRFSTVIPCTTGPNCSEGFEAGQFSIDNPCINTAEIQSLNEENDSSNTQDSATINQIVSTAPIAKINIDQSNLAEQGTTMVNLSAYKEDNNGNKYDLDPSKGDYIHLKVIEMRIDVKFSATGSICTAGDINGGYFDDNGSVSWLSIVPYITNCPSPTPTDWKDGNVSFQFDKKSWAIANGFTYKDGSTLGPDVWRSKATRLHWEVVTHCGVTTAEDMDDDRIDRVVGIYNFLVGGTSVNSLPDYISIEKSYCDSVYNDCPIVANTSSYAKIHGAGTPQLDGYSHSLDTAETRNDQICSIDFFYIGKKFPSTIFDATDEWLAERTIQATFQNGVSITTKGLMGCSQILHPNGGSREICIRGIKVTWPSGPNLVLESSATLLDMKINAVVEVNNANYVGSVSNIAIQSSNYLLTECSSSGSSHKWYHHTEHTESFSSIGTRKAILVEVLVSLNNGVPDYTLSANGYIEANYSF